MDIETTMRAGVLHGPNDLRCETVPTPVPGDDDVLVQVQMNGLCGSDIHFFEDGRLGPFVVSQPYIPGHEACGIVVVPPRSVGPETELRKRAAGARVAIEPGIPCRRCAHCKSGRYNLCRDVTFLSAPPVNGTFAEYVAVPWDFAHPLPDSVDDEQGAFIEPVSVAVQACSRCGLSAGATVAILGAGPIGLVTFLVARSYGAARVVMVDVLKNRLSLAAELGAETVDARSGDAAEAVVALTAGLGAHVVFDTTGSSKACASAPEMAARGGSVVLVGWPEAAAFAYPVESIIEKELDVHGVNRYCNTYPRAIALMASGAIDIAPLVTHRFRLEQVVEAFRFTSEHRDRTIKVMVSR